jgi:hypothetical protein
VKRSVRIGNQQNSPVFFDYFSESKNAPKLIGVIFIGFTHLDEIRAKIKKWSNAYIDMTTRVLHPPAGGLTRRSPSA